MEQSEAGAAHAAGLDKEADPCVRPLTGEDQLQLLQLQLRNHVASRQDSSGGGKKSQGIGPVRAGTLPEKWSLTQGIRLHPWQEECRDRWIAEGGRGVIKVVTGAGKTILALAAAEKLQNDTQPELRLIIVVPTIVLLSQWYEALVALGNLSKESICRLGGGFEERLDTNRRVLISVLASAAKKLSWAVAHLQGFPVMLVVDECHRAGAKEMSRIFDLRRDYSLGLSATPERDDSGDVGDEAESDALDPEELAIEKPFEETLLGEELGPIIYEVNYARAVDLGILPKFEIRHYGLLLNAVEETKYRRISDRITKAREELEARLPGGRQMGASLVGNARRIARRGGDTAAVAARFVSDVTERKRLLYRAEARDIALLNLIRETLRQKSDARILLFHESVDEVEAIFGRLEKAGERVAMDHSRLPESLRRESIRLFREGDCSILVSAKALIEGFDVPAADVGIVVASTSSVRQRIQTLGRILRKGDAIGPAKVATLHVLYIEGTTDRYIYEKVDWEHFVGAERNLYFRWDVLKGQEPEPLAGPPLRPLPAENEIDFEALRPGERYPGRYEGLDLSLDTQGNIRNADGELATEADEVRGLVRPFLDAGAFCVTPLRRAVLVWQRSEESGSAIFCGSLGRALSFEKAAPAGATSVDPSRLQPGDPYPVAVSRRGKGIQEWIVSELRGKPALKRKLRNGATFADGDEAQRVLDLCQRMRQKFEFDRIWVTPSRHAVFQAEDRTRFLAVLAGPLSEE